jgi:hypothetical protein
MDWTLAPVVALMIFTANPEGDVIDGTWFENKPYVTCMLRADSMRAQRRDPYKMPACIRVEAAQHFMETKHDKERIRTPSHREHHDSATRND